MRASVCVCAHMHAHACARSCVLLMIKLSVRQHLCEHAGAIDIVSEAV